MSKYITLVEGDFVCNIPKGMTNGEVIRVLFPKANIFENESNVEYPYVVVFSENDMNCYKKEWWNAPYQKGGEDKNDKT